MKRQNEFLRDFSTRYLLYKGGYGAGKTNILVKKALALAWLNAVPGSKGSVGALYEPTFDLITDLLIPEMCDVLDTAGITYELRVSRSPKFIISFPHGKAIILLKSFENWRRLVGGNYAWAGIDELDTINKAIALKSWRKLMGRIRVGRVNQIFVTTTPEGYQFCYEFFEKKKEKPDRKTITVCSLDNPFLSDEYIDSLYRDYPAKLVEAYVYGKYVNMEEGNVYYAFDRHLNNSDEIIRKGDRLLIGMDFNINRMCAAISVMRGRYPVIVEEVVNLANTPTMIDALLSRFPSHHITIYPDASAKRGDTRYGESDLDLLRQAGFTVISQSSNPLVSDRVNCANAAFWNAKGERRLRVNVHNCPWLVERLETQPYKNGAPMKDGTEDMIDAATYLIYNLMPIQHAIALPGTGAKLKQIKA